MEPIKNQEVIEDNSPELKIREKQIGNTLYLVTANYSGDKKLSELLLKAIEREAESL